MSKPFRIASTARGCGCRRHQPLSQNVFCIMMSMLNRRRGVHRTVVAGLRTAGRSMRNIKVAWDNCLARRNQSGTGVYAARLLEHLTQQADLCVEVFDGWPNGSAPKTRLGRAMHAAGNLAWTHAHLPFRLRGRGFDLLHSPAFISPIVCPCPTVITVHDIAFLLYPSHFARWWVAYMK